MKKVYESPLMILEEYVAEKYVAGSDCGLIIKTTPEHGHVQIKGTEIHCAFTSNNCGTSVDCVCIDCNDAKVGTHQILTQGTSFTTTPKPESGEHNCHILDNHEDAVYFANNYRDTNCGNGVAKLLGLKDFSEIENAWS